MSRGLRAVNRAYQSKGRGLDVGPPIWTVTWETEADWDAAAAESMVHHEQPTGTDWAASDVIELGYPSGGTSLEAYWPFDEDSGTTVNDVGPNSNDGTVNGDPVLGSTGVLGTTSYDFDGTDDFVEVPSHSSLNYPDGLTFSVWANFDTVGNRQSMLSKYDTANNDRQYQFRIGPGSGELAIVIANGDGSDFTETQSQNDTVSANTWHHLAARWAPDENSGVPELFVDGSEVTYKNETAQTSNMNTNTINLHIGTSSYTTDREVDGNLEDIRLYSRTLSLAEITTIALGDTPAGSLTTATKTAVA